MATIFEAPGELDALADQIDSGRIVTEADKLFGGQFIRSRILDRTGHGVDVNGTAFVRYSARYAQAKSAAGGRTDQVDLYSVKKRPHMLNTIVAKATSQGFEVGFYGEEAIRAQANNEGAQFRTRHGSGKTQMHSGFQFDLFKATGTVPERRFFAANEQDIADVHEAIGKRIDARLARATSLTNLKNAVDE